MSNQVFQGIKQNTEILSQQNDKQYSLQIDLFKKEQQIAKAAVKQLDSLEKLKDSLNMSFLPQDWQRISSDNDKAERYNQWLKNLKTDIYLDQTIKVVADIQNQRNLAKGQLRKETPAKSF
jgi:carboxyl-terminal processing protease